MSKEATTTGVPAGEFITEDAVRTVFGRRRSAPARVVNGLPADSPDGGVGTAPVRSGARPLRRWSVAELLARAIAPPPSTT